MAVSEGRYKNTKNSHTVTLTNGYKQIKNVKVQPWTRVNELKTKISKEFNINNKLIRLFFCNTEMLDELTMLDYKVIDAKSKLLFNIRT
jgi:hypothetical protein